MKKYLIVALVMLAFLSKSHGQTSPTLTPIHQLYVVIADNKKFITYNEIESKKNESGMTQKTIDFIKPEWIERVQILKGKKQRICTVNKGKMV